MDKYHIFNEIGAGKNSQVFKGRQKKTVTYVAVKRVAKDQMSKVVNEARSRRPAVLRRLHAVDATRVHQTRSWVVYFFILRPFGPRRETAMLRAGPDDARLKASSCFEVF
jgi:serine/threonine protein kinase